MKGDAGGLWKGQRAGKGAPSTRQQSPQRPILGHFGHRGEAGKTKGGVHWVRGRLAVVGTSQVDACLNALPLLTAVPSPHHGLPNPCRQPSSGQSGGVDSMTTQQPFEAPQDDDEAAPRRETSDTPAGTSAAVEAEPEDPWASLQAAYRPGAKVSMTAAQKRKAAGARGGADEDEDEDEVELLDQGRPSSSGLPGGAGSGRFVGRSGGSGLAAAGAQPTAGLRVSGQGRPQQPARISGVAMAPGAKGKPLAGGWGDGDLAAAGTLMLDDELPTAPGPAGRGGRSPPGVMQHAGLDDDAGGGHASAASGMVGAGWGRGRLRCWE